jgi:hypothetical protein
MESKPTVLMIPCFAGARWQLDQLRHLPSEGLNEPAT